MNDSLDNNINPIILVCLLYFIYYNGLNGRNKNKKYLLAEIGNGGLANRINCLASSLLMSILCKRKLQSICILYILVFNFSLLEHFIIVKYNISILANENFNQYKNITVLKGKCKNPCNLYQKMVNSNNRYIKFRSAVDIVPSLIKCKLFYNILKRKKLLMKAEYDDLIYQYFEVNSILYTKYIQFKDTYVNQFEIFKRNIKNINNSVGIHYRLNDACFSKKCTINYSSLFKINKDIKSNKNPNNTIILLSTVNTKVDKFLTAGFNYTKYMSNINPVHISRINRKITNDEISKTVGDLLLTASAKYLVLTAGSTYSYLILSIGGLDSNKRIKEYSIYDSNGNKVDKFAIDYLRECTTSLHFSIF